MVFPDLHGLLVLTVVHVLAVASPGPDFVFITQQTLAHGRKAGLLTTLGITLGLTAHLCFAALGLATLVAHSASLLSWVKLFGGIYLIYLGVLALRSQPFVPPNVASQQRPTPAVGSSIAAGFLCNALNPKAPVYFISLFTLVLSPQMPLGQLVFYGVWMMLIELFWFSSVVVVLTLPTITRRFQHASPWLDRILGGLLVVLGINLLLGVAGSS